jgi:hypothetical protein
MAKKSNESSYKARQRRNGGADRYGRFREGRQVTPDLIGGHTLWCTPLSSGKWS